MSACWERLVRMSPIALLILVTLLLAGCSSKEDEVPDVAQRVIDLVAMRDLDGLVAAASLEERPCTRDPERSPQCDAGDAEGTIYAVFPSAVCQGFWTADIEANMDGFLSSAGEPFAVARLGRPPDWTRQSQIPYGEYVVIFAALSGVEAPQAVAVYVSHDEIVRTQIGCRRADQFLEPGVGEERPKVIWQP